MNPKTCGVCSGIKTQDSFSTLHGYLATEHFNKKTKGTAWPSYWGYGTDIHAVSQWLQTSYIHNKMNNVLKKLNVFTPQVYK